MPAPLEDIAHISVNVDQARLIDTLVSHFAARAYRRIAMKSGTHLASYIDWDSPLAPPPEFRCFMVLPSQDGWTNLTDELNILDEELAASLSSGTHAITVRGYTATERFEYEAWVDGCRADAKTLDPSVERTLGFLRGNQTHITRLPYDELGVSLPSREFDKTEFVGFRRI